ncbi:hypothetical protein LTR85_003372 [Meristemomyces frigidus]|nr:hypothetical protein LTR85_003372 [Meristemomyces frigidus]
MMCELVIDESHDKEIKPHLRMSTARMPQPKTQTQRNPRKARAKSKRKAARIVRRRLHLTFAENDGTKRAASPLLVKFMNRDKDEYAIEGCGADLYELTWAKFWEYIEERSADGARYSMARRA